MKSIVTIITSALFLLIVSGFILFSCSDSENPANSENIQKSTEKHKTDLSTPPPGSQATPEKWDTFTDQKKQDAWSKYLESVSPGISPAAEKTDSSLKTGSANRSTSVTVAKLSKASMDIFYYGLGEVEAGKKMKVVPAINATAKKVYVEEGDFVETGALLFALDSSEWLRGIEQAGEKWETELNLARIRLNEANQAFERARTFFEKDLITKNEFDKAEQTAGEAQLNLEKIQISRETELENLQENYKSRLGTSPGKGYISSISFSEGESVNSSDYVEIVNLEEVQLNIEVPENIIPRIRKGAIVKAKAASASRYGIQGEVTGYSILPSSNRTYNVRALLKNRNQRLFPGILMEVQIQVSQLSPRIIVPRKSVISDGGNYFIYVVEDKTSKKIPVTLGTERQGLVQIDGDLKEGDLIVIEGQTYIKPGAQVTITETKTYIPERTEL